MEDESLLIVGFYAYYRRSCKSTTIFQTTKIHKFVIQNEINI
uniref:Uncharacterized protein n=3 Tax=Viruses TaxID=10239 RepID=A0A8S5NZP5_9CAUD|nr:MAG TPA: hypothetical protein [Siphoviridae sp. ctSXk8]DAE10159.1 MAG TPA: hypothetical protein [Siphoviridae sp. ctwPp35]DAE31824.1 MAG TPA: hypothetical protein [virus sp. ctjE41]DAO69949.1 MAG TPA: hypothetical protein [Caudoviricetes sp.]DAS99706.1 MAG TPA: hypothetical protein [Caudoviricetes sp.]